MDRGRAEASVTGRYPCRGAGSFKVHLVDGTFELFRCYHGAPRATSQSGREVGAVRGLIHTLLKLLRRDDVTHVAVAVDQAVSPGSSNPGSGRSSAPDSTSGSSSTGAGDPRSVRPGLAGQHRPAADAIRALGMVLWPMARRYQADDALASGALRYKSSPGVDQVVICTPDKDLAEVVDGNRVVLWNRIRDEVLDEAGVRAKFGVAPAQIPEFLGLAGDVADGLPGVPGWGAKSAAAVLARYGTIEEIPLDATEWDVTVRGAARLAESLRERRNEALLCRNLAQLHRDVPLVESVGDLEWRGALRPELEAFCEEIGDTDVLSRVPRWRGEDSDGRPSAALS